MDKREAKEKSEEKIRTYGSLVVTILAIVLIFGWGIVIGKLIVGGNKKSNNDENKDETTKIDNEKILIKDIKYFEYSYTNGYAVNSDSRYSVNCSETCIVKIKNIGESEEAINSFQVDKSFIDSLVKIINDYDVIEWKGFSESDNGVLDGDSFSFIVRANDGIIINASGYMKWPKNYKIVKKELDNLFQNVINN